MRFVLKCSCIDNVVLKFVFVVMCFIGKLVVFSRCWVCVRCRLISYCLKVVFVVVWKWCVNVCVDMVDCVVSCLSVKGLLMCLVV